MKKMKKMKIFLKLIKTNRFSFSYAMKSFDDDV